MAKSKSIAVLAGLLLIAVGIFYYQYRFYRTPIVVTTPSVEEQIVAGGPPLDGIPAINEPKFESVFTADQYLDDNGFGIVVEQTVPRRFYPFQILVWHMVVNDIFDRKPLLITYDPLAQSANVFERVVDGSTATFFVSGKLFNSNLLMSDAMTGALWSQLTGATIMADKQLKRVPSFVTQWKNFKSRYPSGQVLSRNTGANRDYTQNPYGEYQQSYATWFPVSHRDERLDAKAKVFGVDMGGQQKAYPEELVRDRKEIRDQVGGKNIMMYWDEEMETVRTPTSIDEEPIIMTPSYWFVWAALYPSTQLFTLSI